MTYFTKLALPTDKTVVVKMECKRQFEPQTQRTTAIWSSASYTAL